MPRRERHESTYLLHVVGKYIFAGDKISPQESFSWLNDQALVSCATTYIVCDGAEQLKTRIQRHAISPEVGVPFTCQQVEDLGLSLAKYCTMYWLERTGIVRALGSSISGSV